MAAPALPLAVFAVLVPWAVYRRVRMNIGRQPLGVRRHQLRVAIMLLVLALIAGPSVLDGRIDAIAGLLGGVAVGVGIGLFALRHTRFFQDEGAAFYEPHPYIGLALVSLLLARMGWRLWQNGPQLAQGGGAPPMDLSAMTPLTLALFGLIVAYNVTFSVGLLRHDAKRPR